MSRLLDATDPAALARDEQLRVVAAEYGVEPAQVIPTAANLGDSILVEPERFAGALLALPLLPRVAPEELYFPAAQVATVPGFSLEDTLQLVRAASTALHRETHPTMPVRAEPKVGRNEPCLCASGKKARRARAAWPSAAGPARSRS